jgi:hypothetical protein
VNEQVALACAFVALAVETAAPTEMATAAIAIADAARVTLIDLNTGLPPLDLAGVPQSPRLGNVGTLTDLPLKRKGPQLLAKVSLLGQASGTTQVQPLSASGCRFVGLACSSEPSPPVGWECLDAGGGRRGGRPIISDGSGQMPDKTRPSTRLPAVLGRVVSIYGDAEREQRLLSALQHRDAVAFMHLQTGLPALTRKPGGETETEAVKLETTEFGVHLDVQHALANLRTDLDAFSDAEAWALMADGYLLAGRIVPLRPGVAGLGTPSTPVGWAFDAVAQQLGPTAPDPRFLKILQVGKERFLKPARMVKGGLMLAYAFIAAVVVAIAAGTWLLLTPHRTALFVAALAILVSLGIYIASDKSYVKPVAIALFDVVIPALLSIPLLGAAALQLAAGRRWRAVASAQRLGRAPEVVPVKQP